MIIKRPANTRGIVKQSWIESFRTFSNNSYWDSRYIQFSDLQAINDDRVQPNNHTPRHLHQNIEIFGYVVDGSCTHRDNLGNTLQIPSGAVQRMSNGTGIWHTEGNSSDKQVRYLQLWIDCNEKNTIPEYDWYQFTREDKLNNFLDITSKLPIKQDAKLLAGIFTREFDYQLNPVRRYYLYVVLGSATINGDIVMEGDGIAFINESLLNIISENCEILLFDLR